MALVCESTQLDRLVAKAIYAADALRSSVGTAEKLKQLQKKINFFMQQAQIILTWKRSLGALKMVGSAAKSFGAIMVLAAPLHPKLNLALRIGNKMWKLGAGLKILNYVAGILKNIWQSGCRNALIEFTHCSAQLSQRISIFGELIHDMQGISQSFDGNITHTSQNLIHIIQQIVPEHQVGYVTHVMNMVFGDRHYSPLFDFLALSNKPSSDSNFAQLLSELESFNFTNFVELSDSKTLVAIGSFLHISRELVDFLDGLRNFTEQDCRFLSECLVRCSQETLTIMRVVSVLTSLDKIRKGSLNTANSQGTVMYHTKNPTTSDTVSQVVPTDQTGPNSSETNNLLPDLNAHNQNVNQGLAVSIEPNNLAQELTEPGPQGNEAIPVSTSTTTDQTTFAENSRNYISKSLSTFSQAINQGTNLLSSAVWGKPNQPSSSVSQFDPDNHSANRI
ncbi:uncharacterized protein LOC131929655 [Physella acuta]|uniref:uncharacterized protein LOC131929655 n=1 Tax=Physella acuta TaxID=109671 RepID=UPI0027DC1C12|nr:uncharacterized protein LOC131929655 [Physella acuta]XP_059141944.1 uncharacterized protein LOC131929655 [Physella acuta]